MKPFENNLNSTSESQNVKQDLKNDLIAIAYSKVFASNIKLFFMSTIVFYIFYQSQPENRSELIVWYITALIVYTIKVLDAKYYHSTSLKDLHTSSSLENNNWVARFIFFTFLVVATWNYFIFTFFPSSTDLQFTLLLFVVMITACGTTALASYPLFFIPFQIGMLYPFVVIYYSQGGYNYIFVTVYMLFTIVSSKQINAMIDKMVKNNIQLKQSLNKNKQQQEALEQRVNVTSMQIGRFLDSSGEAFIAFDADMTIDPTYSKACIDLLGCEPAGLKADRLFFTDEITRENFRECTKDALKEKNSNKVELYLSLLPQEFYLSDLFLTARYKKLTDQKQIMMVINDASEQKKLSDKIHRDSLKIEMIVAAVSNGSEFINLVKDFQTFLIDGAKPWLEAQDIESLFCAIHTFKGSFSQFGFYRVPLMLHNVENDFQHAIFNHNKTDETINHFFEFDFQGALNSDLKILSDVFGENFLTQGGIVALTPMQMSAIEEITQEKINSGVEDNELLEQLKNIMLVRCVSLQNELKNFNGLIERMSDNLEKLVAPLEITGDDIEVQQENLRLLMHPIGHIIRNSIDHGIETPDERLEANKDETGKIGCHILKDEHFLHLTISDDGRGIDEDKLRQSAAKTLGDASKEISFHDLLFMSGLSTHENTTLYSGRGIGVSAVKKAIDDLNGTISVETRKGIGTLTKLSVPLKFMQRKADENSKSMKNISKEDILNGAMSFTKAHLENELGLVITTSEISSKVNELISLRDLNVLISINGSISFTAIFSYDNSFAQKIFEIESEKLEVCSQEIYEMIYETISETANVIFGHLTSVLEKKDLMAKLSIPTIVVDAENLNKTKSTTFEKLSIETEYGGLDINFFIDTDTVNKKN